MCSLVSGGRAGQRIFQAPRDGAVVSQRARKSGGVAGPQEQREDAVQASHGPVF